MGILAGAVVGLTATFAVQSIARSNAVGPSTNPTPSVLHVASGGDAAALASASSKAGSSVEGLGTLPNPAMKLTNVNVHGGSALIGVELSYSAPGAPHSRILVDEYNVRFTHPANYNGTRDPNVLVDVGAPWAEVWGSSAPNTYTYTVFVQHRTYFINIEGGAALARPALSQMIASLAPAAVAK